MVATLGQQHGDQRLIDRDVFGDENSPAGARTSGHGQDQLLLARRR